jgi:serine/threonine protein kinase
MTPQKSIVYQLKEHEYTIEKELFNENNYTKYLLLNNDTRCYGKVILLKEFIKNKHLARIWNNEIDVARVLKDELPLMVQLHETWRTKTHLFVIYVYHKCELLEDWIAKSKSGEAEYSVMLKEILTFLSELKGLKFIHRQFTPGKILITNTSIKFIGHKYITREDRKTLEYNEFTYFINNTKLYHFLAPEVLRNEFTTFKSCVFSFGAIAYYLFLKEYPIQDLTLGELRLNYSNPEVTKAIHAQDLPELHPEIARLIECAMMVKYSYRDSLTELRLKMGWYLESINCDIEKDKEAMFKKQQTKIVRSGGLSRGSNRQIARVSRRKSSFMVKNDGEAFRPTHIGVTRGFDADRSKFSRQFANPSLCGTKVDEDALKKTEYDRNGS